MKIVHSHQQRLHNPPHQVGADGIAPHLEIAARFDALVSRLDHLDHVAPDPITPGYLKVAHTGAYIDYLQNAYAAWVADGQSKKCVIPSAFPPRTLAHRPSGPLAAAGWYCADTFTPIMEHTFESALHSAASACTAARLVAKGDRAVYALCRPPGHHAGPDYCGGFCYVNNAAIAVVELEKHGIEKVAVLDIDYHHGNGTQDLFYQSSSTLFVSIHGDPNHSYPYFSGYESEIGTGKGKGFTMNLPLPPGSCLKPYLGALDEAIRKIERFDPEALVISYGADICPEGDGENFDIAPENLAEIGKRIQSLNLPTVIIQEGGYNLDMLPEATNNFLQQFA